LTSQADRLRVGVAFVSLHPSPEGSTMVKPMVIRAPKRGMNFMDKRRLGSFIGGERVGISSRIQRRWQP